MAITEESQKFIDQVDALRKQGFNASAACRKIGRRPVQYFQLKSKLEKTGQALKPLIKVRKKYTKRKPQVIDIPVPAPTRAYLFVGTPEELLNIVRSLG